MNGSNRSKRLSRSRRFERPAETTFSILNSWSHDSNGIRNNTLLSSVKLDPERLDAKVVYRGDVTGTGRYSYETVHLGPKLDVIILLTTGGFTTKQLFWSISTFIQMLNTSGTSSGVSP